MMAVTIGVLKETNPGERRVAISPEVVKKYRGLGAHVLLERGLGEATQIPDANFGDAEFADADTVLARADVLLKVAPPTQEQIGKLREGTSAIGYMQPHLSQDRVKLLRDRKIAAFAMELLPRTTRAQAMDVLSSQAGVAGYKAVLIAAELCVKFFPMLTTAAGTIRPAKVLIVGAGVAGLQAIATARRLGAQVEGFDVRPETKEQIESLGAKFLDLGVSAAGAGGYARELTAEERAEQQKRLAEHLTKMDAIVTTAAVPGRKAPIIVTKAMVEGMRAGTVLVDLAAEGGGNCELTRPGETFTLNGVTIAGPLNLPSMAPLHASEMYARNLHNFLVLSLAKGGEYKANFEDDLVAGCALTFDGAIKHEATRKIVEGA
jgi:H+-translocating NAD(P) transhydrogenase subunit alpha